MALEVRLEQVRKRTGGRIHLTVRVPEDGAAQTLCGKTFQAGEYVRMEDAADCQICQRRRSNEALISSAFFQQDLGEELLKLSLQQARQRRPEEPSAEATKKKKKAEPPKLIVVPEAEPEQPKVLGELELAGLKRVSETVYLSPAGAIVRLKRSGEDWQVEEVAFNGPVQVVRRRADRIELKIGDLRVVLSSQGGRLEAAYREEEEE